VRSQKSEKLWKSVTLKVCLYRTRTRLGGVVNDFSLFYLDHSFANAAKPRLRSV